MSLVVRTIFVPFAIASMFLFVVGGVLLVLRLRRLVFQLRVLLALPHVCDVFVPYLGREIFRMRSLALVLDSFGLGVPPFGL